MDKKLKKHIAESMVTAITQHSEGPRHFHTHLQIAETVPYTYYLRWKHPKGNKLKLEIDMVQACGVNDSGILTGTWCSRSIQIPWRDALRMKDLTAGLLSMKLYHFNPFVKKHNLTWEDIFIALQCYMIEEI